MLRYCGTIEVIIVSVFISGLCPIHAQGPLTPPDPPGPTMKSLDQIEPRTPVSGPTNITDSGSYYLTENLPATGSTHAIRISGDHITVDLNGYTIFGDGSAAGIIVTTSARDLRVLNGKVAGCTAGLDLSTASGCFLSGILATTNLGHGILCGDLTMLESCIAANNGTDGFNLGNTCSMKDCLSFQNGDDGIQGSAECNLLRCTVKSNLYGIYMTDHSATIQHCTVLHNVHQGILCENMSVINSCFVRANGSHGIKAASDCRVEQNTCLMNGTGDGDGANISVISNCLVERNTCRNADIGIEVTGSKTRITHNHVGGNTQNYAIVGDNQIHLLLSEVPEVISRPCRITFSGSLLCVSLSDPALQIDTDDVTVDMAGHTLSGPGTSSLDGIVQTSGHKGFVLKNGTVTGFKGNGYAGINLAGGEVTIEKIKAIDNETGFLATAQAGDNLQFFRCSAVANSADGFSVAGGGHFENCAAYSNALDGIETGAGSLLTYCQAGNNLGSGINADSNTKISECTASGNGGKGISADYDSTVSRCTVSDNGGHGIYGGPGSSISDCVAYSNVSYGIVGKSRSRLRDNVARFNQGDGFRLEGRGFMSSCVANENTRHGIYGSEYNRIFDCLCSHNGSSGTGAGIVIWQGTRLEGNTVILNPIGIQATGVRNMIVRNDAVNNTTNYVIAAGNAMGATAVTPMSGAVSGNSGGSGLGTTDPWANFSH